MSVPIWGKLADLRGRKPVLLAGIGLFLAGSIGCGLSGSMGALVAAIACAAFVAVLAFPTVAIAPRREGASGATEPGGSRPPSAEGSYTG